MTDPRIHQRRVRVQRERGHRRLGILLGALLAAALAAGTVAVLHTSLFGARTVVIAGAVHTQRGQILRVTGLDREPPLIDVDTATMARRIDRLPWVAKASVAVEWPSTVAVAVVERIPVAASHLASGGYALLDATGRVLSDQATRPRAVPLVAITGLPRRAGGFVGASARSLLVAAAALPVSLLGKVDEMVDSATEGIVLRLSGGVSAIVGDDDALAQKYVSLATVLRRVSLEGVGAIDLSVPAAPVLTPPGQPLYRSGKG